MTDLRVVLSTMVLGVVVILFLSFLLSWPVYMLWNGCLVGAVSGVNDITWLQGWGLSALFGMLFKTNITSK